MINMIIINPKEEKGNKDIQIYFSSKKLKLQAIRNNFANIIINMI